MSNVYQIVSAFSCNGEFLANVQYFELSEVSASDPLHWADGLNAGWLAHVWPALQPAVGGNAYLTSTKSKRITGGGGPTATKVFAPGSEAGTNAGQCDNTAQCALLNYPVVLNGKNVTGKTFMPASPSAAFDSNNVTPTFLALMAAYGNALLTTFTLAGGLGTAKFCVYNRATRTHVFPIVAADSVIIGNQQRRLRPI